VYASWANVNSQVFAEIVVFVSGLNKYKEYIDDEDNNSFLIAFKHFFVDLLGLSSFGPTATATVFSYTRKLHQ